MKISNLRIGTRLGLSFAVILALSALMTAISLWRLSEVGAAKAEMVNSSYKETLAQEWLRGIATNAVRTLALAKTADADDQKMLESEMSAQSKRLTEIQKELEKLIETDQGKALISVVGESRAAYLGIRKEVFQKKADADFLEVKHLSDTKLIPAMHAYVGSVQKVLEYQQQLFKESENKIDAIYVSSRNMLIALGVGTLLLGAALAWIMSISITRPLNRAVTIARTVASGDLTTRIEVDSADETGLLMQSLKDMNESLQTMVTQVRAGTDTIATASTQIAAGNLDLSSRTEQQASSLEETASSMEELTSTVRNNADNARQANQLVTSASNVAVKGGEVVSQVVHTMEAINQSASKIVDIIGVIDGIAFQTNILALNAAVEAARAGEQGRGFAVVASEVRTLAQRSAAAAKEIKALIGDSVEKVETGGKLVTEAGATMDEIVSSVRRVTDIMAEIMAASQEQSSGIEQVNQAIGQMDQVTQQNASLVEQAAAAAESMQEQAKQLAQIVGVFKVDGSTTQLALAGMRPQPVPVRVATTPKSTPALRKMAKAPTPRNAEEWEEF